MSTLEIESLDDKEIIMKYDKGLMLNSLHSWPELMQQALENVKSRMDEIETWFIEVSPIKASKPSHLAVVGMGGSALGAILLRDYLYHQLPVHLAVIRSYDLPAYIRESNSLIIGMSYSGNTEETLSAMRQALKRNCMVVSISSGGMIPEISSAKKIPHFSVPKGLQPRASLAYMSVLLYGILASLGFVSRGQFEKDVLATITHLEKQIKTRYHVEVPTEKNPVKQLALQLKGHIPYVISAYESISYRWRNEFNENGKTHAFTGVFPEFSHNQLVGWKTNENIPIYPILVKLGIETERLTEHMDLVHQLLMELDYKFYLLELQSIASDFAKFIEASLFASFTSVYFAIANGIDPTPVNIIDKLKTRLKKKNKFIKDLKEDLLK